MYKLTSCLIVLVLFFASASVSVFAGGQLLTNPGFEDGDIGQFGTVTVPGWNTYGTDAFHHDEPGNVIDAKAIKSSDSGTIARQDFSVTAGEEYIFSVKMLSSSSDPLTQAEGVIFVKWHNDVPGAGTKISEYQVGSFNPGSEPLDTWKTVAGRLTAPPAAQYGRIALQLSAEPVSGYIHLDDASVREVNMAADLNNDDVINQGDFALLAADWQQSSSPYSLDGDVDVDIDDLIEFIDNWLIEDPGPVGYSLVWADEFNGTSIDTTKWNFEIGNGDWGWGNNELEYYTGRPENARIENGNLVIEARAETYQGYNYTSARMTTQNKAFWTYGKMEARIQLPYGQGMWPAFWMMPQEFWNPGWPESGEIDIMEAINTMDWVKSSLHYGEIDQWGGHPSYGSANYYLPGGGNFSQDFHIYGMEWEEGIFKFFVDGVQIGSTTSWWTTYEPWPAPFNRNFFFILNVAVGGQWPGSPDGSTVFPQQMLVDWVRVYQKPATPQEPIAVPGRIEAEDYDLGGEGVAYHDTDTGNTGGVYRGDDVDIEACIDTGGGYNVGWINAGEWMHYTVDVTAGTYDIDVRVASQNSGRSFHIEVDGVDVTGSMSVPNTGGWQNWQTVTTTAVTLPGGEHVLKFVANTDGFNLNYIDIQ